MYSFVKVVILQLCAAIVTATEPLFDPARRKFEPNMFICVKTASISSIEKLETIAVTLARYWKPQEDSNPLIIPTSLLAALPLLSQIDLSTSPASLRTYTSTLLKSWSVSIDFSGTSVSHAGIGSNMIDVSLPF